MNNEAATSMLDIFIREFCQYISDIDFTAATPYSELYTTEKDKNHQTIFTFIHQRLNELFDFLNCKYRGNGHYNAHESRELLKLIEKTEELLDIFKKEKVYIKFNSQYWQIIQSCKKFLATSYGSEIPEDFCEIKIIKYEPIIQMPKNAFEDSIVNETKTKINLLDKDELLKKLNSLESLKNKDPAYVIGTCKELIESFCKAVLIKTHLKETAVNEMNFPTLIKEMNKCLKLTPSDVSEHKKGDDCMKSILGSVANITVKINELRNIYGTGHGKMPGHKGLSTRHSDLVYRLTHSLLLFWQENYELKK